MRYCLALMFTLCALPSIGAAQNPSRIAVLPADIGKSISAGDAELIRKKLLGGLTAVGLDVVVEKTEPPGGASACGPTCRKAVAAKHKARYVVGAQISGEDRYFKILLWIADGYSGKTVAKAPDQCDLCGIKEVGDKVDLAASSLRKKLDALKRAPMQLSLTSNPPGATISVDGTVAGKTPITVKLPSGMHKITASYQGHFPATKSVAAVNGIVETQNIKLVPQAPSKTRKILGYTALGTGIASLAAGIALMALHGGEKSCGDQEIRVCEKYDTVGAGGALLATGAVLAGTGIYFAFFSAKEAEKSAATRRYAFTIGGRF